MRKSSAPEALDTSKTPDASREATGGGWDWDVVSRLLEEALMRPASERHAFLLDACGGDRTLFEEVASLAAAHDAASEADDETGPLERLAKALTATRRRRRDDVIADDGRGGYTYGGGGADGDSEAGFGAPSRDGVEIDPEATVASAVGADGARSAVGQRIGPYALVREIGRGGMGVVYLARRVDGQYDRDVALKLLRAAAYDARHRERFLAERQFLAMLSHPHIARMFDGGVTAAGQPFFTMEYVDGVRLDRYCDEQRVSIPGRIRLFLQVCDAVSAAHRSLVVHRDIKPNNVLVTRDGMTKLLDFGIATVLDADTGEASPRLQLRLCTPAYASPEQIRGGTVTAASDVYSLGAVLYEVLTGLKPPRADEGGVGVMDDGVRRTLGGDLEAIVRKAMHPDLAGRYASVDLLRDDLERYLLNRPVSAHRGGVFYRTRKLIARHRMAVAACVLVVMSLAAGATVTLVQASRARAREEAAVAEAAMRTKYELAMTLHHKGDITQAAAFFREAVEHGRRTPHVVNSMRVDSLLQLARLLHLFERDPAAAEPLYREAVGLARVLPDARQELATALQEQARVLYDLDRAREAEAPGREALAMWRQIDGAKSDEGLGSVQALGDIVSRLHKDEEAEALYREALAIGVTALKAPHPHLIGLHNGLAFFLEQRGRIREAAPLREIALRNAVELYGDTHPLVARALTGMGDHHIAAGAFEEAERVYRRAVAVRQNIHPAPHWRIAEAWSKVGYALFRQGRYQDAEAVLVESYARMYTDPGAIPESADRARSWLIELYDAWGRPRDAARYRAQTPSPDVDRRGYAVSHGPR